MTEDERARQFDAVTALRYAASIARPRLVGTPAHDAVANELVACLEQFGYHVERERFVFSTALNALLALALFTNLICLAAIIGLRQFMPGVAAVGALSILMAVVMAALIGRSISSFAVTTQNAPTTLWRERIAGRLGRRYTAANLVASLRQDDRPRLTMYLVAHYDSKSQRWPLVLRIALFTLLIPGTSIVIAAALLERTPPVTDAFGIIAAFASALLALLGTGNASPGAIDNASGVGTVLHLAEILAARSDWRARWRVIILLTSAEEVGLMGATAYVKEHTSQLQSEKTLVLNFDGIGIDGELQWVGAASSKLAEMIQQAARKEAVPIRRFRFIGALFDHMPFAQRGLDAVSLIAVGRASRSIHTRHDRLDRLHMRGFDQAGRVALRIIDRLTTDYTDEGKR